MTAVADFWRVGAAVAKALSLKVRCLDLVKVLRKHSPGQKHISEVPCQKSGVAKPSRSQLKCCTNTWEAFATFGSVFLGHSSDSSPSALSYMSAADSRLSAGRFGSLISLTINT